MKRLSILWMACVLSIGGYSTVSACAYCDLTPAQQRGVDQVANQFGGDIGDFRALYALGLTRNRHVVLPAGNNLLWTVEQDGQANSVYRPDRALSGKQVVARRNGELIALFYPDDRSFLFAVLDKPIPVAPSATKFAERRVVPSKKSTAAQMPQIKVISAKNAYTVSGKELYIPPTH